MLENLAEEIRVIISDYHSDDENGFVMTNEHIISWVNQFEELDRTFVLTELLYVLKQGIYVSKEKAKQILWEFVIKASEYYDYQSIESFLRSAHFISSQNPVKSQSVILALLEGIIQDNVGLTLNECGTLGIKHYIYLDDVLASGGTFKMGIKKFIDDNDLLSDFVDGKITFLAYFFCLHTWGTDNTRYSLKMLFNENNFFLNKEKFIIGAYYKIENSIKGFKEKLNLVYPEKSKPEYDVFLASLVHATAQENKAFRNSSDPFKETFFSSKENRLRLEKVFLDKGLMIIASIQDEASRLKHKPLGKTYQSYKTFGTGTLFFTWRNISNTCPIVLWWDNPAHNWQGLFPLSNRGN